MNERFLGRQGLMILTEVVGVRLVVELCDRDEPLANGTPAGFAMHKDASDIMVCYLPIK